MHIDRWRSYMAMAEEAATQFWQQIGNIITLFDVEKVSKTKRRKAVSCGRVVAENPYFRAVAGYSELTRRPEMGFQSSKR